MDRKQASDFPQPGYARIEAERVSYGAPRLAWQRTMDFFGQHLRG